MSNTIRIRTTPNGNDKYLKVNLEQDFDFIEILSLNISQEDAYRQFCSDYGVVVGRVLVNSGFGVPNAKVSVFIPIDEVDKQNPTIRGLYPYELITDKDYRGIRYNLLPNQSETNNNCFTPVGTFPTKRGVLDNDIVTNIYCKYYKFTTTTNYAGDFMIFGVPIGTYTIHVDADISDIGIVSQRPYDLVRQGTPEKLFDSPTKFMGGTNIDKLPQIKTANIGVNVQPFWGDLENCQVGITRVDVDLNYSIQPSAIFFGSIFGDQDKNSVSKNCRPRKGLGELCEQVTSEGSVEMIRYSFDGEIEDFSVQGGRVIDEDGTWAYQIPMNLDYFVTAEDGTLIPSNDPNIGLPTRSKVRFRIGMDETGGEGRLRTRAKYLVPNNPKIVSEIDYNFNEKTKDSSFKNLYWNKIYSISSFIPRYQPNKSVGNRNITAIKNVDGCVGDKNPFPYNRVDTDVNPIFSYFCIIISIINYIVFIINAVIIGAINGIIGALNLIINFVGGTPVPLVPCVTVPCPTDNGVVQFAPGCGVESTAYFREGLSDCIAFSMAKSLNMYKFDFYNDWVNGTLYSFLLKYKKRKKGNEKFCEYDCGDFLGYPDYSGVDENENNIPDNDCNNQYLLDTMYPVGSNNNQNEATVTGIIREGLIKKLDDEFYYASTNHKVTQKLFATDIICLGSVFECDWQGFPNLYKFLTPTSYNLPPDIQQMSSDGTQILETGIVDVGDAPGLLFSVNCLGLHVDNTQALNFRHICEILVDSDAATEAPDGTIISQADGVISSDEISVDGKFFRNSFLYLNSDSTPDNEYIPLTTLNSDFNTFNLPFYDFTSLQNNPQDYIDFRGYPEYGGNYTFYDQPEHSFFMYFGSVPGKSSVEKLLQRYFGTCKLVKKQTLFLDLIVTPDSNNDSSGGIIFEIIGGHGPYTYTVFSSNGYSFDGTVDTTPPIVELTGLAVGTYIITIVDFFGFTTTQTVVVAGPPPLFCNVFVSNNSTSLVSFDGQITANIGGGLQPYSYSLLNSLGGQISSGIINSAPLIIDGLGVDLIGYTLTITDVEMNSCSTTGLSIVGQESLVVLSSKIDTDCYNQGNGQISLSVYGGVTPYTITTTGPNGYFSGLLNMFSLGGGNYVTTVVDNAGSSVSITTTVNSSNPQLTIVPAPLEVLNRQCLTNTHRISFNITAGLSYGDNAYISYKLDNDAWENVTLFFPGSSNDMVLSIPNVMLSTDIKIRFSNTPTYDCYSNTITITKPQVALPTQALNGSILTEVFSGVYNHTITVTGGIGVVTNNPLTIPFTYNQPTQTSVATITNSPSPIITTTITDSVGCQIVITG